MESPVKYLLSLRAVRERAKIVWDAAKEGSLSHFDLHEEKINDAADFVTSVIKRDFGPDKFDTIPPHGRWQHFEVGGVPRIANLVQQWEGAGVQKIEITRRLVDLFFVSVLLDAGAGDHWRYTEPNTGNMYERSEGIAVASLDMFKSLKFTCVKSDGVPCVDGRGLMDLEAADLMNGFQASESNPLVGVEQRAALLGSLGSSLLANSAIFGEDGRPGNIVDHMIQTANGSTNLELNTFWELLQTVLIPIWPKDRTTVEGQPIGDAWPLSTLQKRANPDDPTASIQPFHKLSQWLTYSLLVPFDRVLGMKWVHTEGLTALAEYRNGGLFVDMGVLSLKQEALKRGLEASEQELPIFDAGDDVIVEWRALTVALLDVLYEAVLGRIGVHLTIAQMLEAGSWKSGREIAAKLRPSTKSSPILIRSDGTLF